MGNWDATPGGGLYFKREWITEPKDGIVREIDKLPNIPLTFVRYWDRAATKPTPDHPDPDWTVGARMAKDQDGNFYVCGMERDQLGPAGVEALMRQTAERDSTSCPMWIEQDPGSGGKNDVHNIMTKFSQFPVRIHRPTKDKLTKGLAFSAAAENGLIYFVKGTYTSAAYHELENFDNDGKKHDDIWDAIVGAYNVLAESNSLIFDLDDNDVNESLLSEDHFTTTM